MRKGLTGLGSIPGNTTMVISHLDPGCYIILISTAKGIIREYLVKE
ncbi:MAG: hypothetical protein M3Q97_06975 [Bacteroidota bacterium]|nr:hypothetical protein [Bacteroidota bacterium]